MSRGHCFYPNACCCVECEARKADEPGVRAEHEYVIYLRAEPRGMRWVEAQCSCGWLGHPWGSTRDAHIEGKAHVKEMSSPDQRTERPSPP